MKKYLTVAEVEFQDDRMPIWALNGSFQSEIGQAGDVHVGIPKINGSKIDPLYLPQTFLPTCLTEQIPRAQLLAASEFRNAVASRMVLLITPEYAEALLQEEGVEEERERLAQLKRIVREATAARSIAQSGAEIVNTSEIIEHREAESARSPKELDAGFIMLANTFKDKEDIEIINALRGRGKITRQEINHLLTTLVGKPKTQAFLQAKLGK